MTTELLPVRTQPSVGEVWSVYVARTAHANHVQPSALAHHLGVTRVSYAHQLAPPAVFVERAQHLLDLSRRQIEDMHLARYTGIYLRTAEHVSNADAAGPRTRTPIWTLPHSRACPSCLSTGRTWLVDWHLNWYFACLEHSCYLTDACPQCDAPLPALLRRATVHAAPRGSALAFRCPHPRRSNSDPAGSRPGGATPLPPTCATLFDVAEIRPAPSIDLKLQAKLVRSGRASTNLFTGTALPTPEYFSALRSIASLYSSLDGLASRQLRSKRTQSVGEAARTLRAALTVADADSPDAAAEIVESWIAAARTVPTARQLRLKAGDCTGIESLIELVDRRNQPLTRRATPARAKQQLLWTWDFTAENIPAKAWACALPAALLDRREPPSNNLLRAFLSVMINRIRTADWESAATELGWTPNDARNWQRRVIQRLGPIERRLLTDTALRIATALHEHPQPGMHQHPSQAATAPTGIRVAHAPSASCAARQAGDDGGTRWCPCP